MSASEDPRAGRPAPPLLEELKRLQGRHRELQKEHDIARRRLNQMKPEQAGELRSAWRQYCDVIAELDDAATALQHLSSRSG